MTVSAVALEQRRIADLEAQGIYVRRVSWRCRHAPRLPVDLTKVHPPNAAQRRHQTIRPWRVAS